MVFSSLAFLFRFLPAIMLAYYVSPARLRNGVLFIGSLVFYGYGEPEYVMLLLFSTVVDYAHGYWIGRWKKEGKDRAARLAAVSSVLINLGLLCVFKYADFLIRSAGALTGRNFPALGLSLPVGISFYTFQTMSYTIDVYRGKAEVQKNFIDFGAYVSMFPQLIAGPIVRYVSIERELKNRRETVEEFSAGTRLFIIGLGKKVLLANQLGALWAQVLAIRWEDKTILLLWMGLLAFGLQIYFDFSGYSDMACGLGRMFGFHFPENFHYPYQSRSITEFWRRWHITLGSWFREYVYIPLGGSRKGKIVQVRNIMVVWVLTGIWHGASFNFLLWGLYFGALLLLEKLALKRFLDKLPPFCQNAYALLLIFLGWVLFAFEDMGQVFSYLGGMFGFLNCSAIPFISRRTGYLLYTNLSLILISILGATAYPAAFYRKRMRGAAGAVLEPLSLILILFFCIAFLVNAGYNPFLYFRF